MASFKKLCRNASFDLELEALSPIHIGTESSNENKNLMMKNDYNEDVKYVITGSSVKGVVRSYLSDLAVYFDTQQFNELLEDLFGTQSLKGRIFISDSEFDKEVQGSKTINAIPRLSARDPKIIEYEVIRPTTKWVLHLDVMNPTAEDFGLMALVLKALYSGSVQIGHGKSRGFGRVALHRADVVLEFFGGKAGQEIAKKSIHVDLSDWKKEKSLISERYLKSFEKEQTFRWMQFGVDALAEKVAGGV
ncbi:RAMP superfamily CRISPR-associated protein [Ureibacillus sp. FSL K6-8385]|uniref:RAMP superfamily CRISPR-associated protein n=1 Tax=Ureibacillus TaxID=160795 RepID=UPI0015EF1090|nr:RAMP superfamily CRISPR-associated protein [Ureibacillus terrenus]MED3660547.1 RAMP superfamily CRISPR-associated protein [Ureibacillus terrenus]MED3764940.1 RAMP superfamily CRISPR-associated protein [Ureibacillus terrenus]